MCRKLFVRFLKLLGPFEIDVAEDGEDAIEKARSSDFDLIFLNLAMPRKDGMQATATIRNEIACDCPIIAVSTKTEACDRARCLNSGMNDVVGKPVRKEILKDTLDRWLPATS